VERKDFIEKVGMSGAAILVMGCLGSCSKSSDTGNGSTPTPNPNKPVDFTINITTAPYNILQNAGGFYVDSANSVIIAKTSAGTFIAVSSLCTHQAVTIEFQNGSNRFYCSGHGSTFSTAGAVTTGPATTALKAYKTSLSGSLLRIYE
jgi:cytochrome b6-f complex iron-sulfur subunit